MDLLTIAKSVFQEENGNQPGVVLAPFEMAEDLLRLKGRWVLENLDLLQLPIATPRYKSLRHSLKLDLIDRQGVVRITDTKTRAVSLLVTSIFQTNLAPFFGVVHSLVGTEEQLNLIIKKVSKKPLKRKRPKFGVFTYRPDISLNLLADSKIYTSTEVIHPEKEPLLNLIEAYFNGFCREMGNKKINILLHGIPGTGKTSLCKHIATLYADKAHCVFANSLRDARNILENCAKFKTKVIVFVEDCERELAQDNPVIKSFLSGVREDENPSGSVLIMTTNRPKMIPASIRSRRGRIDKAFHIDILKDESLKKCLLYYGRGVISDDDAQIITLQNPDGLTGADIQSVILNAKISASQEGRKVLLKDIEIAVAQLERDILSLREE